MPDCWGSPWTPLPVKVYGGWYGDRARGKLRASQANKGFYAVFPDCGSFEASMAQSALRLRRSHEAGRLR